MLEQDKTVFEIKKKILPPLIKTPEFMSFVEEMCNNLPEETGILLKNISTIGKESRTQFLDSFVCEKTTQILLENPGVAIRALPHLDNVGLEYKIGERLSICTNAPKIRQVSQRFCLEAFLGYNHSLRMARQTGVDSRLLVDSVYAFYRERRDFFATIKRLHESKYAADLN